MRRKVLAVVLCLQFASAGLASNAASLETECEWAAAVDAALNISESTYPSWVRRATGGERFAQLVLGLAHTSVRTYLREKADTTEGARWLEEAAKGGSSFALGQLSGYFFTRAVTSFGREKEELERLSAYWARTGAEAGVPRSQARHASNLATGRGGTKDEAAAVHWWTLAANQGSHVSQAWLSIAYDQGIGVERSAKVAFKWALLAARPVQGVAMTPRERMKSPGSLKVDLSDEEIAAVEREVKDWIGRYEDRERRKADANEKECGRREILSNKGFW